MAHLPSAEERARFETLMERVLEPYKDVSKDVSDRIYGRLADDFENPKVSELEFLLQEKFTPERARFVLFFPDAPTFGQFFPRLIADPPRGAPKTHPQAKLQVTAIALLYLVHCQSWPLMEEFVLTGGLHQLVAHLLHPNLYLRSQVVEVITAITSAQDFDWFSPPKTQRAARLHDRMLHVGDGFVSRLLGNASGSYPGGSHHALQLLAFWLSWSRKLYWGARSPMTTALLKKIEAWAAKDVDGSTSTEEVELAQRLYDDFKRFAPSDKNAAPATAAGVAAAAALGADEDVDPDSPAEVQFRAAQGLTGPATKGFLNQKVLGVVPSIDDKETAAQAEREERVSTAAAAAAAAPATAKLTTTTENNGSAPPQDAESGDTDSDFQPAAAFCGSRPGFCFRSGEKGLGYYRDDDGAGAVGPAGVIAGDADADAAARQVEQMRLTAATSLAPKASPNADASTTTTTTTTATRARKPPRARSEKEDIPDALNDSDDDSDFGGEPALSSSSSRAAGDKGAGSDSDDDLPEPSWKQQQQQQRSQSKASSSSSSSSAQKAEAGPRASAMQQASPSCFSDDAAAPTLPAPQVRKPAAALAAGLDSRVASIMTQLLNRGTASWGDPVVSSDEEDIIMGDAARDEREDAVDDRGSAVLVPSVGSVSKSIAAKVDPKVLAAAVDGVKPDKATTTKKNKKKKKTKDKKNKDSKAASTEGGKRTKKTAEFGGFGMSSAKAPKLTKPPKSGRVFEAAVKAHAGDETCVALGHYFTTQVEPGSLPTLLSTGMSSECFSVVLKVFEVNLLPQHAAYVVEFLRWLAETPRFSMMAMMMGVGDQKRLGRVWDILQDAKLKADASVSDLMRKYTQ